MPFRTPSNISKRKKKNKKTQSPPNHHHHHHHRSKKHDTTIQEEIEQQLRRQRQAAQHEPPEVSSKRLRVGKYVYDEEKKCYFPGSSVKSKRSKADSPEPLFRIPRRERIRQGYSWMLEAPVTISAHQRYTWLNEWACRLVWKQSYLKFFPWFPASIPQLPPLWCRTFQPSTTQHVWMLQQGHIVWQSMEPPTVSSSSSPGECYALRLFENNRYQYTLEYSEQGTIVYQMDLEQQTYQARVHARGEVYDILRLSNGVVVYSYTGGRLECSPQKLPNMDSDILCLEEYRWNNDDSNGNSSDLILILMGHRNGTVSLWDFSNRAPITAKLPSFVKHTGPVVAILCLPQSRAVLVQTALGGIHRYAIGRYQLVYEFPLKESASPGAVRGMAVDSSETVVWCPHLSETVELRLCSLATGEWIQSHILQDPFVRLELDPTCDGGYWIRAWNAQGSYRMISLHSERKKVIDE